MTTRILELVLANGLIAVLGCGMLPLLRLARTRRELVTRLPLGYAVGLAATGILAADLAVVSIPVGRVGLPLLAAASLALGLRRVGRSPAPPWRLLPPGELVALGPLVVIAVFAYSAARLFAVKPLVENDGWVIWGTRARALYDFGHPIAPVFTSAPYQALQHPLLLPSLEALDFRFMGAFDGTLVHLQLLSLAVGFVGGGWTLLRGSVRPLVLATTLLAIVTTPVFFQQLQTNYADVPLAMFVALGVAALAGWLATGAPGLLPAAALFLAAGALTKNEGECFALTAFLAALAVSRRSQRRPLLVMAGAIVAADLPWRIWLAVHDVKIAEYSLSDLLAPSYLAAHAGRVWPAVRELTLQISRDANWSYVVALVVLGLGAAIVTGHARLALFGACWLVLSFAGLVAIYWISTNTLASNLDNSSYRTIDSLVLGGALLVPVMFLRERRATHAVDDPPAREAGPSLGRTASPFE